MSGSNLRFFVVLAAPQMLQGIFGIFRGLTGYDGSCLFPAAELASAA
jgi:hypothetical protein